MPFFVSAWFAAISSGAASIAGKLSSKHTVSNPWLFYFILTMVIGLLTVPLALANKAGMPVDWLPIILVAIFSTLFNIFWIFSNYALDVSVLTPLFNFRGIFAVLIGVVFLSESLNSTQAVVVGLIIIAGMFASIDEKMNLKAFFSKKIGIGLLTMLFLAINNAFVKVSLAHNDLWTNNLWVAVLDCIFLIPFIPLYFRDLGKIKLPQILSVGSMGLFLTIYDFTANAAYAVNVGITSLIVSMPISMIMAFLLSIFMPNLLEKHPLKIYLIRFAATAAMIAGSLYLAH